MRYALFSTLNYKGLLIMQVTGFISTNIESRQTKTTGKTYYTFRLAENFGKGETRTTTWYDVMAYISEFDADLLTKGQLVTVQGKIEAVAYNTKDGKQAAALRLIGFKVEPYVSKNNMGGLPG